MQCHVCGDIKARLLVPCIGPDGVSERAMCLKCGEPHTVQPMEGVKSKDGDVHLRLFLTPEEMADGCTRHVRLIRRSACPECFGVVGDEACAKCAGRGSVVERVGLDVKVPSGVTPQRKRKRLRIRGEGSLRPRDGKRGDVYLHVAWTGELAVQAGSDPSPPAGDDGSA